MSIYYYADESIRDLKVIPCPFCGHGGKDGDGFEMSVFGDKFALSCENNGCYSQGPFRDTEKEAVEAWNKRVISKCPADDPYCPCQDGDPCNYEDAPDGTRAMAHPEGDKNIQMIKNPK